MKKVLLGLIICLFVTSFGTVSAQTEPQFEYVPTAADLKAAEEFRQARLALIEKVRELTQIVLLLQEQLDLSRGVDTEVFKDFVALGYENESVKLLQKVLASDPIIYPEGLTTGFFGMMTEKALSNFQSKFGLEKTGLFNKETRVVLTEVLLKYPFSETPEPYLDNTDVKTAIKNAKNAFSLKDLLENDKVVFSTSPVFSAITKTTDSATLQRILATDPEIYPEGTVSGTYTASTSKAVLRFQKRYKLSETGDMSSSTLNLLKSILIENSSSTIRKDLLLMDSVQPDVLVKNNARKIFTIFATREYKIPNVSVSINYYNGSIERFLLYSDREEEDAKVATKADVVAKLAREIDRDKTEIDKLLIFNIAEVPEFPVSALIYAYLNGDISFTFTTVKNGKYEQYEYLITFEDPDWKEKVEFNNKEFVLRELRDYIRSEAFSSKKVDQTIIDAIRLAVADELGIPEEDIPDFPITYSYEIYVDNRT